MVAPTQWQIVAKEESWGEGASSLSSHPSTPAWPLPRELQLFLFLFPLPASGGRKISFAFLRKVRNITRREKKSKREAASLSIRSLWDTETMQAVLRDGLAEDHSHWTSGGPRQLPPRPCLHPHPALSPCFLRNHYPKTELKSISWSREWPAWKLSDVSELRLCQ